MRFWPTVAILAVLAVVGGSGFAADKVAELRDKVRKGEVRLDRTAILEILHDTKPLPGF